MSLNQMKVKKVRVNDVEIEVYSGGTGKPILVLHGFNGMEKGSDYLESLAKNHYVIAPVHPGFDHSERPSNMDTIDDYAYFYLNFLEEMDLEEVQLIGFSLGGWIASEIAVKSTERISSLVLVDALGIKVSDRETPDIKDFLVLELEDLLKVSWHNPTMGQQYHPLLDELEHEDKIQLFKNRETTTLIGWSPFMHNPKLRKRLHRIKIPTLVLWGENDGIVSKDYGEKYAQSIPNAEFVEIKNAGHYPQLECSSEFVKNVETFHESIQRKLIRSN